MCVDEKERRMRGDFYDAVYQVMIQHNMCKDYVTNENFLRYLSGPHKNLRNTNPDSKEELLRLATVVGQFFRGYKWEDSIVQLVLAEFIHIFEEHGRLDGKSNESKKNITRNGLYFLIGMITFDHLRIKKII